MLISTPILFILQIILLWHFAIFNSKNTFYFIDLAPFIQSFITFIVLPFVIAALLQYFSKRILIIEKTLKYCMVARNIYVFRTFTVIASQIHKITHDLSVIATVIPIYIPIYDYRSIHWISVRKTIRIRNYDFTNISL